ncbi:MAG TPA: rod-binding protein, partial [Candidatus Paceibacterota bacterium]|nr:rod-binding protein [Candidatus Paceibacterota bacterium]
MTIPPLQSKIDASEVPMEQIAGNKALTEDQKIGEATRQFEAVLLRQILESTQKTVVKSKYSDDSTTASIYRDMVTNQLADSISKSGGLGLGET